MTQSAKPTNVHRLAGPTKRAGAAHLAHRDDLKSGDLCIVALILLGPILLIGWTRTILSADPGDRPPTALDAIDPNVAPWAELAVLPRIGEGKAREIVRYRESLLRNVSTASAQPVFQRPADLEHVRGIGPKTILRVAPYLKLR